MTPDDVIPAADVVLAGGWGDRRLFFEFATNHAECRPFIAEGDREIVGTAVGTMNGAAGWVGSVFVARSARHKGLGGSLTDTVIEALEAAGCRTLVLVATHEGRSIYERRGFTLDTMYRTFEASGTATVDGSLRSFVPQDLGAMIALDRLATGEDRGHLLRRFATPTSARCLDGDDGDLRGFVVRAPWGGGATVAVRPDDAMRILEGRRASSTPDRHVRAGLLAENVEGIERLRRLGWIEAWHAPRFVRGAALVWRPTWLWGQFNLALG